MKKGPAAYCEAARAIPDDIGRAMMIGHNPDLEEMVFLLSKKGVRIPTAALVILELPIHAWAAFQEGITATVKEVLRPRELW